MFKKFKYYLDLISDKRTRKRKIINNTIANFLDFEYQNLSKIDFSMYLEKVPFRSSLSYVSQEHNGTSTVSQLHSNLFSDVFIHETDINDSNELVIFFAGSRGNVKNFENKGSAEKIISHYCKQNNMSLLRWDFPFQGDRKKNIYLRSHFHTNAEIDYTKLLLPLGSSLFDEYLKELIDISNWLLDRNILSDKKIYLIGWSQGSIFSAIFGHLLQSKLPNIKVICMGSFSAPQYLIKDGEVSEQGLFYFPSSKCGEFLDYESLMVTLSTDLHIIGGKKDRSLNLEMISKVSSARSEKKLNSYISLVPQVGHNLDELLPTLFTHLKEHK